VKEAVEDRPSGQKNTKKGRNLDKVILVQSGKIEKSGADPKSVLKKCLASCWTTRVSKYNLAGGAGFYQGLTL